MQYAAYIRTSIGAQSGNFAIATQRQAIESWVERQRGQLVKTYIDERAGRDMDRPGLQQMLADAQSGAFDMLVVHRMDRLARREADQQTIHRTLSQNNITIFAVSEKEMYA